MPKAALSIIDEELSASDSDSSDDEHEHRDRTKGLVRDRRGWVLKTNKKKTRLVVDTGKIGSFHSKNRLRSLCATCKIVHKHFINVPNEEGDGETKEMVITSIDGFPVKQPMLISDFVNSLTPHARDHLVTHLLTSKLNALEKKH